MVVAAPSEAYLKMIEYGKKKGALRTDQLFLQSIMAGFWIGVYGNAIFKAAGPFYSESDAKGIAIANIIFGLMFTGAFMAIVYTGSELFTGNTVTMIIYAFNEGPKALWTVARVWALSFFGNMLGCVFTAYFFLYLIGEITQSGPSRDYLFAIAHKKLSHSFSSCFLLAILCNSLVCLATWSSVCTADGAGKLIAMMYCVAVFVIGGYEHVIANAYVLVGAKFAGYDEHNYFELIYRNLIPAFFGNLMAGVVFTGMVWWYALHPRYTDLAPYTETELVRELSARLAYKGIDISSQKSNTRNSENRESHSRWTTASNSDHKINGNFSLFKPPHSQPSKNSAEEHVDLIRGRPSEDV